MLRGPDENILGFDFYREFLPKPAQSAMVLTLRDVAKRAPFFSPVTPWGKPMSVKMTSAGKFGWVSGSGGYEYASRHPNGANWPPIPASLLALWEGVSGTDRLPECCLINFYGEGARMGLHQDRDEADFSQPVVSLSLGDDALFRMGGSDRSSPTKSSWLKSGDVVVMGAGARRSFHGIDRVKHGSSPLLSAGGRINVTMRVVR